ncbi:MAG: hypothetical protein ACX94B_09140 [Henriciella sp.]|nr:hypothetical protein [Hyphomonadaceae bacterium]
MSRFCATAAALVLTACANSPAPERTYLMPEQVAAPTIQVENIANALERFLSQDGDQLILLPNRLDKTRLDYSMESLHVIDRWLVDIHTINRLQGEAGKAGETLMLDGRGDNSVVFAGLYLGQVIRAHSELPWQWQRFDTFLETNPVFAEHYGRDAGLDTFVLVGPQGAATPINTALKRVLFGKEESVAFIAQLMMTEVDLEKAMTSQDLLGMDRRDWAG